jgi:anti-sigma factor RsiW
MKFSDELLIAFVNGELAEPARAAVERALRADPASAARGGPLRAGGSRV